MRATSSPFVHHSITCCSICTDENLVTLWDLPNFPLTEQFGDFDLDFPSFDQKMLFCRTCGHVQLQSIVEPKSLYTPTTYVYRILNSKKIQAEYEFFRGFVAGLNIDLQYSKVLELGAGNFQLANFLKGSVSEYAVCEPMLVDLDGTTVEGIAVIGKFAEEAIDDIKSLGPDFVFGRHFLEHVVNPKELLASLLTSIENEHIFCFEVPSLRHLREQSRFDAIFHDHVQYFDIDSIKQLLASLNCVLLDFRYNALGSNGGSLLFAFKKSANILEVGGDSDNVGTLEKIRIEEKEIRIRAEIECFLIGIKSLAKQIELCGTPIYGFGAAHMLATLNYHLDSKIELLDAILDDNMELDGSHYRNVDVEIRHPSKIDTPDDATFLITSQENRRTILNKLIQMGVTKILTTNVT